MSTATVPAEAKVINRSDGQVTQQIEALRSELDEHFTPGQEPCLHLQNIIDELDRLVALVMQERLQQRKRSSFEA